jgi:hypothetical protein
MSGGVLTETARVALQGEAERRGCGVLLLVDGGMVPLPAYRPPVMWNEQSRADIVYAAWPEGWRYRGRFWRRAALEAARVSAAQAAR